MGQYINFLPNSKNLSAPATGKSYNLEFEVASGVTMTPFSATSNADWVNIRQEDWVNHRIQVEALPNTDNVERTAVVSIATKVLQSGTAYYEVDYDITTIRQEVAGQTGGSINPNYTSFHPKAAGDTGTVTLTTSNVIPSSIGISCDSPYVSIGYLTNSQGIKTGFTWTVPENTTPSARQFTITISAKRSNAEGYAYAYVSGVQPSVNDVGYIYFEYDTVRASASTLSSSIRFDTEYVSGNTSGYTSDYWLHIDYCGIEDSGQTEGEWIGRLDFTVDENPYNTARQGTITIYGNSNIDDSLVQATLHFYQAKNDTGGVQQGYIYCNNPVQYMSNPEATTNIPMHFNLAYNDFVVRSSVTMTYTGNFSGTPSFEADKTIISYTLKNARSTSAYTTSQISVSAKDTSDRTIPPILLTVMQPPFIEYVEFPIWKDTDLTVPTDDEYLLYKITINNDIVYAGRGYAMNGEVTIRLNEIMQQVLLPDLDLMTDGLQDNNAYASALFSISLDGGAEYQKYKNIKCYADWSYVDNKKNILSNPIRKKLDSRQIFVCSAMDYAGNGPTVILQFFDEGGVGLRENVYSLENQIGTIVNRDLSGVKELAILAGEGEQEDTVEYEVVCELGRYCLYYLNADGGWDSFVFNKTSKESNSFERLTYSTNQSNQTIKHRTIEYKNRITKKWTLKTDYLTDVQSLNFAENLVGSPCAYLHDLEDGRIYPVLIKTGNVDYQTFTRNGRKLNKYTIEVELSQIRQRR